MRKLRLMQQAPRGLDGHGETWKRRGNRKRRVVGQIIHPSTLPSRTILVRPICGIQAFERASP